MSAPQHKRTGKIVLERSSATEIRSALKITPLDRKRAEAALAAISKTGAGKPQRKATISHKVVSSKKRGVKG